MKITGLKHSINGKGSYIALAICLIGLGACGWLTIGKDSDDRTAKIDKSSSFISNVSSSYNDTVNVGKVLPPDNDLSQPQSSSHTDSNISSTANESSSETESAVENSAPVADYFVLPLTGEITKPFSLKELQYSETYADWRLHNALDIAAEQGATVHSAGDGIVHDVYTDSKYGKVIKINHSNGIFTLYCGIKTAYVKKGDTVGINQDIGNLGEIPCESAEKSHLHFAAIKDGVYISPLELVKFE
ncbi:MAG: M23 family metallopeptidase [Clostridia bacterium]|nr:M23 family metallopeptidase [Clostridia bacterium]